MSTDETFVHCSEYNKFLNELKLTKEQLILTYLFALSFYHGDLVSLRQGIHS